MNRLTSGTASLIALLIVSGCNNDPTGNLRGGISRIQASPSTVNVVFSKTKTVQVTAVDDQGNPLESAYEVTDVGPGISVKRDSSFFPVFLNDTLLTVPPTAPTFQFIVTGTEYTTSSFKVTSGGQEVTIPVTVTADATTTPLATVASTGPSASDPTVLTLPAPFQFGPAATVTFDAGAGITVSKSDDGRTLTIFPPPGATSTGAVTDVILDYIPQVPLTTTTDVALAVSASVPPQPGTDSPATAPDITGVSGFYDGADFSGADLTTDGGLGAQYYKFTVATAGDYTFVVNWDNDADLDMELCRDVTCSDGGEFLGTGVDQPEEATVTLDPGTYYFAVVFFDFGASATLPNWFSVAVTAP